MKRLLFWVRYIITVIFAFSIIFICFRLFWDASSNSEITLTDGWHYLYIVILLFISPYVINSYISDKGWEVKARILLQEILRLGVYFVLLCSGFIWFLMPDLDHIEPLTFTLGFLAAHITHQINLNHRKQSIETQSSTSN